MNNVDTNSRGVVIVCESWGCGGTDVYISGLCDVLLSSGYSVHVVQLQSSNWSSGVELPQGALRSSMTLAELYRYLSKHQPIYVSAQLYTHLLAVVIASRMAGCRVVSTLHMPLQSWGRRHQLFWRLAIKLSTSVVGVSNAVIKGLKGKNVWAQPVPGGVNEDFFAIRTRRRTRNKHGHFNIVASGRLSSEKDWPTLITAVSELPENISNSVSIAFYGSGTLELALKQQCQALGVIANFYGFVGRKVLIEGFEQASLSVLPSKFEGFGLSAVEAMACAVPTITANFEAAKDFIKHGETGHVFAAGNATELSELITWHFENPEKSAAIGIAGHRLAASKFSGLATYSKYLDIFRELEPVVQ